MNCLFLAVDRGTHPATAGSHHGRPVDSLPLLPPQRQPRLDDPGPRQLCGGIRGALRSSTYTSPEHQTSALAGAFSSESCVEIFS